MSTNTLNWKVKAIAWGSVIAIIGLIFGYSLEFRHFSNTLDVERMVGLALLLGAATGAWLANRLSRTESTSVGKLRWWVSMLVLCTLFMPLFVSWLNRLPLSNTTKRVTVEFIEEKPFAQERFGLEKGKKIAPDGYFIFVNYQGEIIRFRADKPQFPGKKRGDLVPLELRPGNLGFDWVRF
ncbi:MAG: hypothetical protein Kow0027_16290 [Saprospiraceae bacterium]